MYCLEEFFEEPTIDDNSFCGKMFDLDDIPTNKLLQAARAFSDGSKGLEGCLIELWKNNLKTCSCCAGAAATVRTHDVNHAENARAFISMEPEVDIFGYLSRELLDDPLVALNIVNRRHVIRFAGGREKIESNLVKFEESIKTGKKDNKREVAEKVDKSFPYLITENQETDQEVHLQR